MNVQMKWNSIRTKVLFAIVGCLILGVGGTVALLQYSFARNSEALAAESVGSAQKQFNILETREISKMAAVSETLGAESRGAGCVRGQGSRPPARPDGDSLLQAESRRYYELDVPYPGAGHGRLSACP